MVLHHELRHCLEYVLDGRRVPRLQSSMGKNAVSCVWRVVAAPRLVSLPRRRAASRRSRADYDCVIVTDRMSAPRRLTWVSRLFSGLLCSMVGGARVSSPAGTGTRTSWYVGRVLLDPAPAPR